MAKSKSAKRVRNALGHFVSSAKSAAGRAGRKNAFNSKGASAPQIVVLNTDNGANMAKRGPGRPKGSKNKVKSVALSVPAQRRGPGRPRNSQAQLAAAPKRGYRKRSGGGSRGGFVGNLKSGAYEMGSAALAGHFSDSLGHTEYFGMPVDVIAGVAALGLSSDSRVRAAGLGLIAVGAYKRKVRSALVSDDPKVRESVMENHLKALQARKDDPKSQQAALNLKSASAAVVGASDNRGLMESVRRHVQ